MNLAVIRSALVLVAAVGLAQSVPTAAQDDWEAERDRFLSPDLQTGSRFLREPQTAQESDARQMQKALARCIFYANKDEVRDLLANSDFQFIDFAATSFDRQDFFDQLGFGNCLERAMTHSQYKIHVSMLYSTLRNLLAEEVYLYDNEVAPVRAPSAPTVIKARYAFTDGGARARAMAEVADCITYRNAAGADAFLRQVPGTSDEGDAIEALGPTLLTCLETDEAPKLSTSLVRQLVADGLWARSHYGSGAAAQSAASDDTAE